MTITADPRTDWRVGYEARCIVRGGLTLHEPADLDAEIRTMLRSTIALDSTPTETARFAAALIHGYVTTHPEPTPAERRYDDLLAARRRSGRLQRSARAFARQISAALCMADDFRRACAQPLFAHPVHKPVENDTAVIPGPDGLQYEIVSHDGTVLREIPW